MSLESKAHEQLQIVMLATQESLVKDLLIEKDIEVRIELLLKIDSLALVKKQLQILMDAINDPE